jgi:hypothetical protein
MLVRSHLPNRVGHHASSFVAHIAIGEADQRWSHTHWDRPTADHPPSDAAPLESSCVHVTPRVSNPYYYINHMFKRP